MAQMGRPYLCVRFVNIAMTTATEIRFVFRYFDAKVAPIGFDTLEYRKGAAPRAIVNLPGDRTEGGVWLYGNCTSFSRPKGIAVVVVTIEHVEYDDGTSWTLAGADPASAQPLPTPSPG
jgi:hypothetical protein